MKSVVHVAALVLAAVGLIAGCGSQAQAPAPAEQKQAAPAPAPAPQPAAAAKVATPAPQPATPAPAPATKGIVRMWDFMDAFATQNIVFDTVDEPAGKWAAQDVTGYNTFRFTDKDEQIIFADMTSKMVGDSSKLAATFLRATAPAGLATDVGTWFSANLQVFGRAADPQNPTMTKTKTFGQVKYTLKADATAGGSVTITAEMAN